jgi:hypothetical protein
MAMGTRRRRRRQERLWISHDEWPMNLPVPCNKRASDNVGNYTVTTLKYYVCGTNDGLELFSSFCDPSRNGQDVLSRRRLAPERHTPCESLPIGITTVTGVCDTRRGKGRRDRTPDPLLSYEGLSQIKLERMSLKMHMVGGRGGTRTRGPLLAKQA